MGVVQGLTNCMSVGTAGFLAAPTLIIGCLGVTFGLYGFWGAQKFDKRKIRAHFIWLVSAVALLLAVAYARIRTAEEFCGKHNCILDHIYYRDASSTLSSAQFAAMQRRSNTIGALGSPSTQEDDVVALETATKMSSTPSMGKMPPLPKSASSIVDEASSSMRRKLLKAAGEAGPGKIPTPIYREPCYVDHMKPSVPVCVEAHKLSAWTTVVVTVPMNMYFAYIIYSFYNKVLGRSSTSSSYATDRKADSCSARDAATYDDLHSKEPQWRTSGRQSRLPRGLEVNDCRQC